MGTCALCGQQGTLIISHIIPAFVFKWIKKTSRTGILRQEGNPNKPLQDGQNRPLLCAACEERFNKAETRFSQKLFHPHHQNPRTDLPFDEHTEYFAASMIWRMLLEWLQVESLSGKVPVSPEITLVIGQAVEDWKDYLLGKTQQNPIELFALMTTLPDEKEFTLVRQTTTGFRLERGVRPELAFVLTRNTTGEYIGPINQPWRCYLAIIPGFIFVANLTRHPIGDFLGTPLNGNGTLSGSMRSLPNTPYYDYLSDIAERIENQELSGEQREKLLERARKNPDRNSKSDQALKVARGYTFDDGETQA